MQASLPTGSLSIFRPAQPPKGLAARGGFIPKDEIFLRVTADDQVVAFCGHVDLGTGIATSLAQIVAEELDARPAQVRMVLGHTEDTPDQGATIASETIQVTAIPLRRAAAQARHLLLERAAELTGRRVGTITLREGELVCEPPLPNRVYRIGDLVEGVELRVLLDDAAAVKSTSEYRLVGRDMPRVDIPDKVTGRAVYVHDVRVDGMLHGRVVRPPYEGYDHGPYVGRALLSVDRESVMHLPGVVDVVVVGDFVGVVAEREEQAAAAAEALRVKWAPVALPDLTDPVEAVRDNPATPRVVLDRGTLEDGLAGAKTVLEREYFWPYQMHGSIGPSCSVADWQDGKLKLWSGTQNPHMLRADLALLMGLSTVDIQVIRHEAAGCYGRNCADDVGGDAALLSRAVGRPVRVQLSREQEHVWEPKGAAQLVRIRGGIDAFGQPVAYDLDTSYPSNVSPLLALVLTGVVPADVPSVAQMGDRTSVPPYDYPNARVTVQDMPPIARASWFRGVSALPNSFAHDSYIDELAAEAGADPLEYRLDHLPDQRACELLKATADRAGWTYQAGPVEVDPQARVLKGRGLAYAQYVHGTFPGTAAAWSAWVADVEVDRQSGVVSVTRAVVGQDAGMMVNPAGVRHQLQGNVIQSTSRILREEVQFDEKGVESRDWGGYPILTFPELPAIEPVLMERQDQPPLGAGESASVPSAAAIANALYAATGVRFRDVPFTPEKVKARLDEALGPLSAEAVRPLAALGVAGPEIRPAMARTTLGAKLRRGAFAAAFATVGGLMATVMPWRSAIAPVSPPEAGLFSDAAIARGEKVAAAGDCAVCHTAPGGVTNAGAFPLETPFGIIYSTNLTPDVDTGLGAWSYEAFERAMRHGISRDGRHLYPAFPYTAFAKTSDADLRDLYAYLMSQKPVRNAVPKTALKFPYNMRFSMAGWNMLFHDPAPFTPDPVQSEQWNRGAYLAEGLGHCSACHTPRNALGAERWKSAYLAGGEAEGWSAPALSTLSQSPLPWSEDDLYAYLRTGFSPAHGPAGGPMAPVVHSMAVLPDADVRAIAHYIASFDRRNAVEGAAARRDAVLERARGLQSLDRGEGSRIYNGSCASCHEGEGAHLFGARPQLALNSNIQADSPDNLVHIILKGVSQPAYAQATTMPAFGDILSDRQIAELVAYLRRTMAPGRSEWTDLEAHVARLRAQIRANGGH
ncbi:molybdopterin-dependent oxidoreductase [Gluconobacter albidus]|uniref:molybdopterin cofactor-binding domain-containing protein n=1 Tax=Gluconobacter albidus TaxID=318683 RepID=UPI0020A0FE6D|nr:molybdopterin cofactor-binding domain-containing protein [Gluconobacter albidus]MCP1274970.1 molybdopterin-dependent oxidoreductase [Gluconobacter albidus]